MAGKKLTDKQLKDLYLGLFRHYQNCTKDRGMSDFSQVRYEIITAFQNHMAYDQSLQGLAYNDKQNLNEAVNALLLATPLGQAYFRGQQGPVAPNPPVQVVVQNYSHFYSDRTPRSWVYFMDLTPRPYCYQPIIINTGNTYTNNEDKKKGDFLAALAVVVIAVLAVAATAIATYYLLKEMSHNIERFSYNEGWMQAAVSTLSIAAFAFASTVIFNAYATSPLTAFALSLGMSNPASAAVFGVICLSIVGTAAATFMFTMLQQAILRGNHLDALDPYDPHRYELTPSQAEHLEDNKINPMTVRMAIITLRSEMGEEQPLYRIFSSRTQVAKDNLATIRKLKQGYLEEVTVGDLNFDCRKYDVQPAYIGQPLYPQQAYQPSFYSQQPPAYAAPAQAYPLAGHQQAVYGEPPAFNPNVQPSAPPPPGGF